MKTEKQLWSEIEDLRIKYPEKKFYMTMRQKSSEKTENGIVIITENVIIDENDEVINYEDLINN